MSEYSTIISAREEGRAARWVYCLADPATLVMLAIAILSIPLRHGLAEALTALFLVCLTVWVRTRQEHRPIISFTRLARTGSPALIICALIFAIGAIRGAGVMNMLLIAAALAMSISPAAVAGTGKAATFLLACGLGMTAATLLSATFGWGAPLSAVQILFVGLAAPVLFAPLVVNRTVPEPGVDGWQWNFSVGVCRHVGAILCVLTGSGGKPSREKAAAKRRARFRDRSNGRKDSGRSVFAPSALQGLMFTALILTAYYLGLRGEISRYVPPSQVVGMTVALRTLYLSALTHALCLHSPQSIFTQGFFANKAVLRPTLLSLALAVALLLPPGRLLNLVELSMFHHLLAAVLGIAPLLLGETAKTIAQLKEQ